MAGTGLSSVQLQSLDFVGHWGDTMDDSAEILSQSFLQEAIVSKSGRGRDAHSLTLSIQCFLYKPWHHPSSQVPWRMVLQRLSLHETFPNHASFPLLTDMVFHFCIFRGFVFKQRTCLNFSRKGFQECSGSKRIAKYPEVSVQTV